MRAIALVAALVAACAPAPDGWTDAERAVIASLELPENFAPPPDPTNRFADDARAAALGQQLFFDTGFSRDGKTACATCHDPAKHFTDRRRTASGVFDGPRNTPTVVGAALYTWLFWDGRKDSAWSQALGPVENPIEHASTRVEVARGIFERHRAPFEAVFGAMPSLDDPRFPARARPDPARPDSAEHRAWVAMAAEDRNSIDRIFAGFGKAIAAYERLLLPRRAPFDAYAKAVRKGVASEALPAAAVAGLRLFIGRGNCIACHSGPRLTDDGFHNLGLPAGAAPDRGRRAGAVEVLADPFNCRGPFSDAPTACRELQFLDPTFTDFEGAFRTPSLRHVAESAPYMHAGQHATLADVIATYSSLPGRAEVGHREPTLQPLDFRADDRAALVAFLESLSGPAPDARLLKAP